VDLTEILISVAIGLAAGALSGMFGVGGSTIATPFMRLFLGVPGMIAVGTPLPIAIPTAISGTVAHYRRGMVRMKTGIACGLIGSTTAVLGAETTELLGGWAMMIITSVFIFLIAVRFAYGGGQKARREEMVTWPRIAFTGLTAGFVSGFLGVGGGSILVPAFFIILGLNMHEAVATSLLAISIMAIPGSIAHYLLGNVDVELLIPITVAAVIGAQIGANFSTKTQEIWLRRGFVIFLMVIAVWLGVSEI
jgi:hypothetical protein